jgi:hypothetical protein
MGAKSSIRREIATKRLRRLSVQIAGQLPEECSDAIYVLEYAKHLIFMMEKPDPAVEK